MTAGRDMHYDSTLCFLNKSKAGNPAAMGPCRIQQRSRIEIRAIGHPEVVNDRPWMPNNVGNGAPQLH
jgi:hypothetical protein